MNIFRQGEQPDKETPKVTKENIKVRGKFGMYTEQGNSAVEQIIAQIKLKRSRYELGTDGDKNAVILLRSLAKNPGFEEAKDDEVRFLVFNQIRKRR